MVASRGWEKVLNGHRISTGKDEMFCEWMVVMAVQQCEYTYWYKMICLKVIKVIKFTLHIFCYN
jgi:hypothetical protein